MELINTDPENIMRKTEFISWAFKSAWVCLSRCIPIYRKKISMLLV